MKSINDTFFRMQSLMKINLLEHKKSTAKPADVGAAVSLDSTASRSPTSSFGRHSVGF